MTAKPLAPSKTLAMYASDNARLTKEVKGLVEERDRLKRLVIAQAGSIAVFAKAWQGEMLRCEEAVKAVCKLEEQLQIQQAPDASGCNGHVEEALGKFFDS